MTARPKRFISIQTKIALVGAVCLFIGAVISVVFAAISGFNTARKAAEDQAVALANSYASTVKAALEAPLDSARAISSALVAMEMEGRIIDRSNAILLYKGLILEHNDLTGAGAVWEPNAYDGKDAQFVNTEGHDQTGRFVPYWSRNDTGGLTLEPVVGYETGEFYLVIKRTPKETIVEPYLYPVQGKDLLITSLVAPVIVNGQFLGVTAIDVDLSFLQSLVDSANIYDGKGSLVLISNSGVLAGVTGRRDLIGKPATDFDPDFGDSDKAGIVSNGQLRTFSEDDDFEVYVPVRIGATTTPWSVMVKIPNSEIAVQAISLVWRLVGVGVFFTLAALVLLWFAAGQIVRPLREMTTVAAEVSSGNLSVQAHANANDETGVLARAFNEMIQRLQLMLSDEQEQRQRQESVVGDYVNFLAEVTQGNLAARLSVNGSGPNSEDPLDRLGYNLNQLTTNLQATVGEILEAGASLSTAATEIMAATTQQASGASEQSAAIAQTTTTVDEVKTIAEQSSMRAQEVASSSQRTLDVSRGGQRAVQDTIESMAQIKERVEGIAENILALSEQTQQIGEIISTVNDIASQSNMLALNASVEAARAGEHGKGFAVVAVEVRNLAEQSKQATTQVKAILSEIQKATNSTVMATEEGTKGVDHGVNLAAQAREAIDQLTGVIGESAQAAVQMVAAGQQQGTGIDQVAMAMRNINQATLQNLASTRQAERAAQNLNDLARRLTDLVSHYRVK